MDPTQPEIAFEFPNMVKVYKDGRVERLVGTDFVPPSSDPLTAVSSKDVVINPELNISARLFLPKLASPNQKIPLLVYFHGGAFILSSPFTKKYHSYVSRLVAEANVVAVSVDYRRAPEHPIPIAYEDSWAALKWAVSHSNGDGPEPWLNAHADFTHVFLAGESAGANIAHNVAMLAGDEHLGLPIRLLGIALVHPHFWGSEPIGSEMADPERKALVDRLWPFVCPSNPDNDDPRANPIGPNGPGLARLGCGRVLVCVAEKDILRDRGWVYYQALGISGWLGVAEIFETEEEDHGFHLNDLESERARDLIKRLAAFLNRDLPPF